MKLIITADDFGDTPAVNAAITESFRRGLIDRTTMLANAPFFTEACALAFANNFHDKVGIHFNLTNGSALSPIIAAFPGFCRGSGTLTYKRNTRAYFTRGEREAIADECERQIKRLYDAGFHPTHFDSHHHVHTEWFIFQAIEPVLRRYEFSSVRISKNLGQSTIARQVYKRIFNGYLKRRRLHASEYFGNYTEVLLQLPMLKGLADATAEVMTHPVVAEDGVLMDACSREPLEQTLCRLRTLLQTRSNEIAAA